MSLQLAAQHLASKGRGPDTQLVHMAPSEVAGLHALARAHGGQLTTNPDTGLPEAGFLSKLLPTLIGAGLTFFSGGTLTPLMAAGIVGGGTALATGNLGKGLMAGLGAFGGAGLTSSLAGAGASSMNAAATDSILQANPGLTAGEIGREMGTAGFVEPSIAANVNPATASMADKLGAGLGNLGGMANAQTAKYGLAAMSPAMQMEPQPLPEYKGSGPNPYNYRFIRGEAEKFPTPDPSGIGQLYFPNARYEAYAEGGPVEAMSDANAIGANTGFPMANIHHGAYATPYQQPISSNVVTGTQDAPVDPYTGEERFASGGISHLGDYSDGGRLLKGPGDGVSDSIPATIADKRPARLADGEFVVPARIVSELGNGSTDAGARKLYAMMDRVQKARGKTTGKDRVAVNSKADRLLPA